MSIRDQKIKAITRKQRMAEFLLGEIQDAECAERDLLSRLVAIGRYARVTSVNIPAIQGELNEITRVTCAISDFRGRASAIKACIEIEDDERRV